MDIKRLSAMLALSAAFSASSQAATINTTFNVTATVSATCQNLSASTLAFGTYSPLSGSATTANSTVTVTCTQNASYTIALNAGGSGDFTNRSMSSGANSLNYNLYQDASFTTVWGDGTGATQKLSDTGTGASKAATVYGRIPASQNVATGSYSDTITVTVEY